VLPPLASIFVTGIASQLADNLIARGVETTVVRRMSILNAERKRKKKN